METSKDQIEEWKKKAQKWDALGEEIADCYCDDNGDYDENNENEADLVTIGELAATAYGWL